MPVSELLSKMSSFELSEWVEFLKIKQREEESSRMEQEAKQQSRGLR